MGIRYQAVGWNSQKKIYDTVVLAGTLLYLAIFIGAGAALFPNATIETLLIRGLGTCAFLLLHIVLSIGPLCRISPRFLPLLYNRRHLGVTMFFVALAHSILTLIQFHVLGDLNPLVSVLVSNTRVDSLSQFPFQPLGLIALIILFLMAATSHDFWLTNLTAPVWKALHMLVYLAYGLLIMHVALGVLQAETHPVLTIILGIGLFWILGIHLWAALKEKAIDRQELLLDSDEFVDVGHVVDIEEKCAQIVTIAGDRVAVFKYDGKISAVSNACQHQNGPLGEGRIIDGCITCPWHGYQYDPASGSSPSPFTEKIPTFKVKVSRGRIYVANKPNPPGTYVAPARIDES